MNDLDAIEKIYQDWQANKYSAKPNLTIARASNNARKITLANLIPFLISEIRNLRPTKKICPTQEIWIEGQLYGKTMKQETELSKSVNVLQEALRNDPELYFAYQSNIAMAFVDQYNKVPAQDQAFTLPIHQVANDAAKQFLDLFINHSISEINL